MTRRMTTEEFIKLASVVHAHKYDYSLVNYKRNNGRVVIVCKEHGEFTAIPWVHLKGRGACPVCSGNQKWTLERFLVESKLKHGDTYSYNNVTDVPNGRTKLTVVCKKHGDFKVSAILHAGGAGCPRCSGRNRDKTTEEFIEDAREVWGDEYGYEKAIYTGSKNKLIVTCPKHGEFNTTPNGLLRGYGCPKCGGSEKHDLQKFIDIARSVHGTRYDYREVEYVNNQTDVWIICREHGRFKQRPANHKGGQGCPACGEFGFNKAKPAWLYVLSLRKDSSEYVGFGITRDLEFRVKTHTRELLKDGFNLNLIHSVYFQNGSDALDLETEIKRRVRRVDLGVTGFKKEATFVDELPTILDILG